SVSIAQTYSGSPLQILATTTDTLTARFTLPELQVNSSQPSAVGSQQDSNGQSAIENQEKTEIETNSLLTDSRKPKAISEIHFAGADWTLDVGRPRLPIYAQRIGIPVAGTPVVTVIQARPEIRNVENIRVTPDDPIYPTLTMNPRTSQGFYPTQLVEVIPVGFVREQRIASLQINPVQYNPATKQLRIYASVTFRIDFPPFSGTSNDTPIGRTVSAAPSTFPRTSPAFEKMFQGTLRNYEQAKPWRSQRLAPYGSSRGGGAPKAPTLTTKTYRFKIPVTRTDLYRINYNNIKASAGIEPEDINLDTLRLESGGQKQGIYVFDENGNDIFDRGEQIVFYGRALSDNKFTDTNVYWLRFALRGEPSAGNLETSRVEERDATPLSPNLVAPSAFLTRIRFEENRLHDVLAGNDIKSELADHYFWVAFRGGNTKDFNNIELPEAVPRLQIDRNATLNATLRIKFQGASRRGTALHRARISFNNNRLGRSVEWKRQGSPTAVRSIPQARIHNDPVNLIRIEALDANRTDAGSYDFYLDWYEFDYWRNFRADGNRLEFNTNTEPRKRGKVQYRVQNIYNDTIDVYQLNENGIASKLTGGEVSRVGASHNILFEDTVGRHTRYFVISRSAYRSINALVPTPPTP
ncbi:MAG: hypothetical protein OXU27_03325, partial [Candidatus Poribacteria bacterium]|nr:hypothetical protein [Candidatus Poribacteria bacterium]